MTTPTNDRQTSEREQIARDLLEYWPDDIECRAAAAQLRADEAEIAALRAENEALRTVTADDVERSLDEYYANTHKYHGSRNDEARICFRINMLAALQSFIRSKESRCE